MLKDIALVIMIIGEEMEFFEKNNDYAVILSDSEKKELFSEEKNVLYQFIADNKDILTDETLEMMKVWLQLLEKYPEEVRDIDLVRLHNYMAEKSEYFYEKFGNRTDEIKIEKDRVIIFDFQSISLIFGSIIILYPFIFLYASNCWKFVQIFIRKLRKQPVNNQIDLTDFISSFWEVFQGKSKVKLGNKDIALIKELSNLNLGTRNEYIRIFRRYQNTKRFQRLNYLYIVAIFHSINYQSLGLIPYMNITNHRFEFPRTLTPFIEQKLGKRDIFRLILIPSQYEKQWCSELQNIGMTSKLNSWDILYNWNSLSLSARGLCKWKIDPFDISNLILPNNENSSSHSKLYYNSDPYDRITTGFIRFVNAVHQIERVHPPTLSVYTGMSEITIKGYTRDALDNKVILPVWLFSRMNLNTILQICLYNEDLNSNLIKYFELLPKVKIMKSEAFSRYLLFLPSLYATKLEKFLRNENKTGNIRIIQLEKIPYGSEVIDKGTDLLKLWKLLNKET
ncbi:MAG: hypothetical protein ACTSP4_00935 [Candidatus Hodarchaeales archaeon]